MPAITWTQPAKACGTAHIGRCTKELGLQVFTQDEAFAELEARGWRRSKPLDAEWVTPDGIVGILGWTPDYCNQDQMRVGTRWFILRPHGKGSITILGG